LKRIIFLLIFLPTQVFAATSDDGVGLLSKVMDIPSSDVHFEKSFRSSDLPGTKAMRFKMTSGVVTREQVLYEIDGVVFMRPPIVYGRGKILSDDISDLSMSVKLDRLTKDVIIFGDETSSKYIYEFYDFDCPVCRKIHPYVKKYLASHPKTGVVYVPNPILSHKDSVDHAAIAHMIYKYNKEFGRWFFDKMFKMNKLSFASVSDLTSEGVSKFNLDREKFNKYMREGVVAEAKALHSIASRSGIPGTPFFVDEEGRRLFPEVKLGALNFLLRDESTK